MTGSSPSYSETPAQRKIGIVIVGGLCIAVFVLAFSFPWHQLGGVDARTYFEMIQGIADHGLPSVSNGPLESDPELQFPALRARYNHARDGQLWGNYPPVYPYLMAPFYRLGGLTLVIQMTMCTLVFLVLGAFFIGRELTQSSFIGAGVAFMSLAGNAILTKGFTVSSYALATTLVTWSVFFALKSQREQTKSFVWAAFAGFLAGLAVASHLIVFLMVLGLAAALVFSSRQKALDFIVGLALPIVCLAFFNDHRFDSYNPISYGPCPWRECQGPRQNETVANTFIFAFPVVVWAILSIGMAWILRKKRWGLPIVMSVAALAVSIPSILQERVIIYIKALWMVFFDASILGSLKVFTRSDDGLGIFKGRFVLKTLLQSSPAVCLALPAFFKPTKRTLLLILPICGLFATIILRANIHPVSVLGHSYMNIRYVLPAIPLCIALGFIVLKDLEWKSWHLLGGLLISVLLAFWLAGTDNDRELFRRIILLIVPLVLCFVSVLFLFLFRWKSERKTLIGTITTCLISLTLAWGVGVNIGVDITESVRAGINTRNWHRSIEDALPERFAVFGWPPVLDPFLALKDNNDIVYGDLYEVDDHQEFHKLISLWHEDNRPVYMVSRKRGNKLPRYPGVKLQQVKGVGNVYKVTLKRGVRAPSP